MSDKARAASPLEDELRALAVGGETRFEVVEHRGRHYAVRQSNSRISKALARYKDDAHGRTVELVIQVTHSAIPVLDEGGKQLEEDVQVPVMEPELDEKGLPVMVPMSDPKGRPIILDGKPMLRARMRQKTDADGNAVHETVTRKRFQLGKKLFDATFFDTLMEEPNDEGSFIHKVVNAAVKVNDHEEAAERAKKP